MTPATLIEQMEESYGVTLPARYRAFLVSGEYERHPRVRFVGYIRGEYELDFLTPELEDVVELGISQGIADIEEADWDGDYAGYVPLATLSHADVPEPKMFLVLDTRTEAAPVLLFDQDSGFKLFPIASSLETFLAMLPEARADLAASFRPGEDADAAPVPRVPPKAAAGPDFEARFRKALMAHNAKDSKTALGMLTELERERPEDPQVLTGLIAVLTALGDYARALAPAERLLATQGENAERLSKKARLLAHLDRPAEALPIAERAVALARDEGDELEQAHASALAGWTQHLLGLGAEARPSLAHALELDPNVVDDLPELGPLLAKLGLPRDDNRG